MSEKTAPPKAVRVDVTEVRDDDDDTGQLVYFCPWCEGLHCHGACGGGGQGDGHRVVHCHGDRRSPLTIGGVDLKTVRRAKASESVIPKTLMLGRPPLRWMLNHVAPAFRAVALQALFGVTPAKSRRDHLVVTCEDRGSVVVRGQAGWHVMPATGREREGSGYLRLAAILYGIPVGVAAVRFLEAVSAETLDAQAALAIQGAVDDWMARGAAARGERS